MTREPEALADTDVLTLSLLEVEREGEIALLISVLFHERGVFFRGGCPILYFFLQQFRFYVCGNSHVFVNVEQ